MSCSYSSAVIAGSGYEVRMTDAMVMYKMCFINSEMEGCINVSDIYERM